MPNDSHFKESPLARGGTDPLGETVPVDQHQREQASHIYSLDGNRLAVTLPAPGSVLNLLRLSQGVFVCWTLSLGGVVAVLVAVSQRHVRLPLFMSKTPWTPSFTPPVSLFRSSAQLNGLLNFSEAALVLFDVLTLIFCHTF